MNSLIGSLHGRDALDNVKSFGKLHEKMERRIENLEFLSNCQYMKVTPSIAKIKHMLQERNQCIIINESESIVHSKVKRVHRLIEVISECLFKLHLKLFGTL